MVFQSEFECVKHLKTFNLLTDSRFDLKIETLLKLVYDPHFSRQVANYNLRIEFY